MRHLSSSFKGKNAFWRYIVMLGAVFIAANTVGGIPLLIGYALKLPIDPAVALKLAANPTDLTVIGIDPVVTLFMMLFPFLVGLITFALLIRPLHGRSFYQTFNGTSSIRWRRVFVSAIIWIFLSALYFLVYKWLEPSNFKLNNTSSTLIWLAVISVLFIPFQATFEEIIFRGYLMQGFTFLSKKEEGLFRYISFFTGTTLFPLLMTSVLFGIMHAWNPEIKEYGFFTMIPQYILFGLLFGIITILDDGVEIAAGAHAANNIFLSIMVTNTSSTLQTPALYEQLNIKPWVDFCTLLATSVLFFLVMRTIYGWKGFAVLWKRVEPMAETGQIL